MRKIFSTILLLVAFVAAEAQAQPACCPEFKMVYKRDFDCTKTGSCASANGMPPGQPLTGSNCKYSTNSFLVVPNLPGFTYVWTVTGGTVTPASGNPVSITWGGGSTGTISVTITSADGSCKKTITENICLRDAPIALFTFTPNNACAGTPIVFTNASTGGSSVSWDFGDGVTAGNYNTVTHAYASPGVYTVTIYVTNDTTPCIPHTNPAGGNEPACCGCTSVYTQQVTVAAGSPLLIIPQNCVNQCLCVGDTSEYCLSVNCPGPITWTVSGGNIISGAGTQCIKIKWTGPYPTSISVSAPNCGNPCGNTATLSVPVLVNNIPIQPASSTACQGALQTYSLPAMPGVFYTWTVSGGTIIGPYLNTANVTVQWGFGTSGTITCTYQNPLKKNCNGSSSRNVTLKPVLKISGPGQTCEGCTAVFMATGSLPVSWTGPAGLTFTPPAGFSTTVSFPVTGTTSTYTITATNGGYCNSPQTASIVVAPKPVLTMSSTSTSACPGTQIKFWVTSTNNTTPVTWVLPPGATMVANTGTLLDTAVIQFGAIPAGGVTVTATQNCAFNLTCSQGTASIIIKKPPVPVLSSPVTNPCIDQTVGYTVSNAVPGITYNWTISNNLGTVVSGQGTPSVNILWHGNSVTANAGVLTVSNCSGSVSVNITVTIPTTPTISVSGTCIKSGMTLTSSSATSYSWTGPGIVGSTITQTISINQPGQYCVTVNGAMAGSCPQQKCITIPPNPYWVKIIPPCSVASCNPNSLSVLLTMSTNVPSPTNCQWMYQPPGGGPFTVIYNVCGNYTATALGTYYLIITDPNGCKDTSNVVRIPQDINICCTTPVCSALSSTHFNFTHSGCQPTVFTGTPLTLPPGWTTGTLHPTICYGDGTAEDFISLNTSHQYPAAGTYTACVVQKVVRTATHDTCCVMDCQQVVIPVVTKFTASYNCNTGLLSMTDASSYYPNSTGASYSWTYSGPYTGTLTNGPAQTITPTASGNYTITLAITLNGCTSSFSLPILVVIPSAPITINPNPGCDGSPVSFSTTPGFASYNWQFGDNAFSLAAGPQHTYAGPGVYNVTLTAVTPDGCTVVTTAKVTIQPKPIVTLTPNPATVCPGTAVTITATINANGNTMCPTLSAYMFQWYNNGTAIGSPTPSATYNATNYGSYYAVLTGVNPSCNCVIKTDTAVINWFPKPVAKILGKSTICLVGGTGTMNLSSQVTSYPTYNWSSSNPGNISFSNPNIYNPQITVNAPGNYAIYLQVIDANGCSAYDTLCLFASNSPAVTINTPGGTLCSGHPHTLTAVPTPATAPPAGYGYLWSTNAGTPSVTVSAAGVYNVTVTDLNTGCSAAGGPVFVNPGPNLSLFPTCCDTICDDAPINISVPLPLGPGQNICSTYSIVWLDNGVPVSPQPSPCNILNTANLVPLLGQHNLSVIVTYNGCTDTSDVFHLFIRKCGCDCDGSHWGEIQMTEGEGLTSKGGPMAGISAAQVTTAKNNNQKSNVNVAGNGQQLKCNGSYVLKCKQPYTINASYFCKDSACNGNVTYSLLLPNNTTQTGNVAFSFTPTQTGTYVLTLYGWCGNKICDSCVIKFTASCDPCDCKGSHWGEITLADKSGQAKPINCKKDYPWKCNEPFTINASYICAQTNCNGTVSSILTLPDGSTITGTGSITYTPVTAGTYTVTLYGMCGGKICDSCQLWLVVDKCPEKPCCRYDISIKDSSVQTSVISNPDATVADSYFSVTGPSGNLFTQVRAEVTSYSLFSNFNNECLSCKSYPFTWASIYQAGNIGAITPQITMYNSVAASFNPSGAGMYQNPREVSWTGSSPFALPNAINIKFLLPPPSVIDCCELTAKICVKFTFRDKDCHECEKVVCFSVPIKKK